jgi:hypothetical protein
MKIPFAHVGIWPVNELLALRSVLEAHSERVSVLPVI